MGKSAGEHATASTGDHHDHPEDAGDTEDYPGSADLREEGGSGPRLGSSGRWKPRTQHQDTAEAHRQAAHRKRAEDEAVHNDGKPEA